MAQWDSSWEAGLRGHANNGRAVVCYRLAPCDSNNLAEEGPSHRATNACILLAPAIAVSPSRRVSPDIRESSVSLAVGQKVATIPRQASLLQTPAISRWGVPFSGPGVECQSLRKCL